MHMLIQTKKELLLDEQSFSAVVFSISINKSNLDINQLFLNIWTQLIQSYNYVS